MVLEPSARPVSILEQTNMMIKLIEMTKTDHQIAFIVAGPLEDILGKDSPCDKLIDQAVGDNHNMSKVIRAVWATDSHTAKAKALQAILKKHNLRYSSFR